MSSSIKYSINLINPFRAWLFAFLALLIGTLTTSLALFFTARASQHDELTGRLSTLIAANVSHLDSGNYRGFVDALGHSFADLHLEVSSENSKWAVGDSGFFDVCTGRKVSTYASGQLGIRLCAHQNLPISGSLAVLGVFALLSLAAWPALQRIEKRAVSDLANMFRRLGAPTTAASFGDILRKFDEVSATVIAAKEQEAELRRTQAIAETTQMLAHDIRKPFTQMKLGLDSVIRTVPGSAQEALKKLKTAVMVSTDAAEGMLEDLMMSSNSEMLLHTEPLNTSEFLANCLKDAAFRSGRDDLQFEARDLSSRSIKADHRKLTRVIANILDNAAQAANSQGTVWIESRIIQMPCGETDTLEFSIGNTGSFIPPDEIEKIFEPHYTKGKRGGTGLGLAIVRKIVLAHQGTVTCLSTKELGTVFTITFPAEASVTAQVNLTIDVSASAPSLQATGKVLVIDDDPFVLDAWEAALGKKNAICFEDVAGVEELAARQDLSSQGDAKIWAIILDRFIGSDTDGAAWAKTARELFPNSRIFLSSDDHTLRLPIAGVDEIIPKVPISIEDLWARSSQPI